MSPEPITLIWVQAWSGAPVYVLAALAQGIALHRLGFALAPIAGTALLSTGLSILAGVVLWGRLLVGSEVLLWNVLNLPALIAAGLLFPLVGLLIGLAFRPNP